MKKYFFMEKELCKVVLYTCARVQSPPIATDIIMTVPLGIPERADILEIQPMPVVISRLDKRISMKVLRRSGS